LLPAISSSQPESTFGDATSLSLLAPETEDDDIAEEEEEDADEDEDVGEDEEEDVDGPSSAGMSARPLLTCSLAAEAGGG
jgi:hypothetical protein